MPSGIPYCDETWNPVVGCRLPRISIGCINCWARQLHNQRHSAWLAGKKLPAMYARPFEQIQVFDQRFNQPKRWRRPRIIFAGAQTDLFSPEVPDTVLDIIYDVIRKETRHTFLILTRRVQRAVEYYRRVNLDSARQGMPNPIAHLPNLYFGVTICNQAEADSLIPPAMKIPAKLWLSVEPHLEDIRLWLTGKYDFSTIAWVVVGSENGSHKRHCKLQWTQNIVEQCAAASVKCFVKQVHLPKYIHPDTDKSIENLDQAVCLYNGFRLSAKPDQWPQNLRERNVPWEK